MLWVQRISVVGNVMFFVTSWRYGFKDAVSMLARSLAAVNCYSSAKRNFPREKAVGTHSNNKT